MRTRMKARKVIASLTIITFVSFMVSPGHAGYLIKPVIGGFDNPASCGPTPPPPSHHHNQYKSSRHHKKQRTHDFVEFDSSPNHYGSGRYLPEKYDSYDPDMSTGDDDPTIYPGMDIDN